ncbi:gliding motility-associated C-terminal domain-containing protein [Arenibacter sp. F20364]|uniref:T9SS type B sorting domain-containing protein n=1 Tax=Arenibacter sp. F20364 TaxID=2926415 RepID=UPI001FF167F4|nr:gliding motility-associated C-terminal domain-containing protein [Arenibacter sp. F20364]MCK0189330.1 gliding motility-associated C-terminal domain-containing protein [Arenibacter sp. F20364]
MAIFTANKAKYAFGNEYAARLSYIGEVKPPTTTNTLQEFCALDQPTLYSVQVNESKVIWYDKPFNGNQLPANTLLKANTTFYAAQIINGEESSQRLAITIALLAPTTPTTTKKIQVFSATENPTIADLEVNETYIIWCDAPKAGELLDFDTPLENGKSYYAAQLVSNCESVERLMVKVEVQETSDLKLTKTVNIKHPMIGEKVVLTITLENDGTSNFQNISIKEHLDRGFNYVNAKTTKGTYNASDQVWTLSSLPAKGTAVLDLEVEAMPYGNYNSISAIETSMPLDRNSKNNSADITLEPSCINIYNEFTPNDDGDNDYFRIDCIETFPESELQVFNRYGALVYQKKAYQNDWRGLANVNGVVGKGEPLPTGTYFYILKTDSLSDNKTGWLFLRKD